MYLNIEQVSKVLRCAWKASVRDHLILLLTFTHGLRRGEVAHLTLDDVVNGKIRVKRLKNSLPTIHPLRESKDILFNEQDALKTWLQQRPQNGNALFPGRFGGFIGLNRVGDIARHYMEQAGIDKDLAHTHSLKHACGAHLIRHGAPLERVRQWLGHKDVKNTVNFYLHITDEEAAESAFAALDNISPKSVAADTIRSGVK